MALAGGTCKQTGGTPPLPGMDAPTMPADPDAGR